jgi:tetratricopeptide (TPR) repeat protein
VPRSAISAKLEQAFAFHQQGKLTQAETIYREIIDRSPEHVEALHFLGVIAYQSERFDEADRLIGRALAIKPDYAEALYDRANTLRELKRPDEALACYDKALSIRPDFVEALNNRGSALMDLKRPGAALASYDKALKLRPDHVKALYNRGTALIGLKHLDEALASYDKALALKPDYAKAHFGRGNVLRELQRLDDAMASYDKALAIQPDYPEVRWNQSICHLLGGDLERGFETYEWRWHSATLKEHKRAFPQPLWLGEEDLSGKSVLLHAEQGFGDTIQFCRYVPMVAARGAHVVLEVQRPLKALLTGLEGARQVIARGEPLPAFDFHCPLLSLPLAFKTTSTTIPTRGPYIKAAPNLAAQWRAKLGRSAALRIGIAWAGSPTHGNDRNRSIAPAQLAPLLALGMTMVSLQKDLRPADRAWLAAHRKVQHIGSALRDFTDTAALLTQMDMVISVDTALAHLAGAMGRPVWILLPFIGVDWRWQLDRADSPWYPTARLFRQPAVDDWASVIDAVARELNGLAGPKAVRNER